MTKIHHATAAKAEANDVELEEVDGMWIAAKNGHTVEAKTAKDALAGLLEAYEEPDEEQDDDEDDDEIPTSSIVKQRYRKLYAERGDATRCGDWFSGMLKEHLTVANEKGKPTLDMDALKGVITDNDLTERYNERWAHLNNGQVRMNAGNMLRARYLKGEEVIVGQETHQMTQEQLEEQTGV